MLGGLYGDLPPPSSAEEAPSGAKAQPNIWSTSTKFAPPTLRKPSSFPPPPPKPKPHHTPIPLAPPPNHHAPIPHAPALVGVTNSVIEEYDPARPNDYEEYRRDKKRKEREAELEKRREKEEREAAAADRQKEKESLNISGEEAWRRRQAMGSGGSGQPPPRSPSPPAAGGGDGFRIGVSETGGLGIGAGGQMSAAQRMMAKMGWKQGQGLGKQEQGITTPLVARKTDRRAGVIVNASESKSEKKVKGVNVHGEATRVLLLRNMVGPGEVDDELEVEVGEECAKYGKVTRVLIFEITQQNFPTDEAVRIFVQFERPEQTTKALVDLDGRFFGGRTVKASFYEEGRFNKNELAPLPGEIPGF